MERVPNYKTSEKRVTQDESSRILQKSSESDWTEIAASEESADCLVADLDESTYNKKVEIFLNSQKKTSKEILEIEAQTRLQGGSDLWRNLRRNLLTASNFGTVCKRLPFTRCDSLVTRLLYGDQLDAFSLVYGREKEVIAISQLKKMGLEITKCGLFIDKDLPYLAATPDGLIGNDGILEIKCPSAAMNLTPFEAILQRKGMMSTFWSVEGESITNINKNHSYYYQIQGQMHITRRSFAIFVVWTPKGIKLERIERDDTFWTDFMERKLRAFYMDCLLPEIVDSRRKRNLPMRNPQYILDAIRFRKVRNFMINARKRIILAYCSE